MGEVGRRLALDRPPYIHIRILSKVHNLLFQITVSNKTLDRVRRPILQKINLHVLILFKRTTTVPMKTQHTYFPKTRTTHACTIQNKIHKDLYNLYMLVPCSYV